MRIILEYTTGRKIQKSVGRLMGSCLGVFCKILEAKISFGSSAVKKAGIP